jgi:ATP-binding cassette subfamily B protein
MTSLFRTLPFLRTYKLVAFLMVVTSVVPVAMELVVPRALRALIDEGIFLEDMNVIVNNSVIMLAAAFIGVIATLGQGYCRASLSQGLAYDLRNRLFAKVQTFSFANLDKMHTGQIITRLSSDVDMIRMFFSAGVALLLRALLMIFGSVALMMSIDWQLTVVMVVLLPVAGIVIWTVMRLAQPLFVIVQDKLSSLNTIVQENLAGIQVVKAFVRERYEIDRFQRFNQDYMAQNIQVGKLMAVALPALTILTNLGIAAVIWFGGRDAILGRLTVGELVAFNNYLMIGMAPLLLLGNILTMVSRADASAGRLWELLDTKPMIKIVEDPYQKDQLQGTVEFRDVTFGYDGLEPTHSNGQTIEHAGGKDVLQGISFEVNAGQTIALLGATGSGKSSLVNLIPRFYDVDAGQIVVGGVDVREWEPEGLRKQIGVVLQENTLFSGTIRENIAYGRPNASLEDVIAAATAAQAHDFISALPHGYDSMVEERGANLSGGQKQRVAIARALLIDPGILILDDSTSAVDLETEARIQKALSERSRQTTTFIVAQRINSVLNADQIIVLDRGRIISQGTHQELLENSPIYQEIYQSQLGNGHIEEDIHEQE